MVINLFRLRTILECDVHDGGITSSSTIFCTPSMTVFVNRDPWPAASAFSACSLVAYLLRSKQKRRECQSVLRLQSVVGKIKGDVKQSNAFFRVAWPTPNTTYVKLHAQGTVCRRFPSRKVIAHSLNDCPTRQNRQSIIMTCCVFSHIHLRSNTTTKGYPGS